MPDGNLNVHYFTLTDTLASEHIYGRELTKELLNQGIQAVPNWRQADIVHLFEVNLFTRSAIKSFRIPKLLRILKSDVPLIISTDDLYFIDQPKLTERPRLYEYNYQVQRWLFNRSDAIIAISESVKQSIQPALNDTPVHVVYHGVTDEYFSDPGSQSDPFILHVSLASKRKNPEAIVTIADQLDERFVIAGSGWDRYFSHRNVSNSVEIKGFVSEKDLISLYHEADIFYFPTLHEGFGLPILEAMASGNAVVASNVYSVPEVTGDTAILHDPQNHQTHLNTLYQLIRNTNQRLKLAKSARERAESFSWKKAATKTIKVYRSAMKRH